MNTQILIKTMEKDVAKVAREISFKLLASVIKKTPVKTGRARNNWNMSEGEINTSIDTKARDNISGKKDIFITNSLNYIMKLENGMPGGSKQAPKGMVSLAINELKNL
jgi:hypothetical protein